LLQKFNLRNTRLFVESAGAGAFYKSAFGAIEVSFRGLKMLNCFTKQPEIIILYQFGPSVNVNEGYGHFR
jgi:hypothetical protein